MASNSTIAKIRTALRYTHSKLDDEINDQIEACLADLMLCGVDGSDEYDENILAAIKLYCKANLTDDKDISTVYLERYNEKKKCLMMSEGYGLE